jgi:hypothetical protein
MPDVRASILENTGTLLVFRIGADDALRTAKELRPDVEADDFVPVPNPEFWIHLVVRGQGGSGIHGRDA